MKVYLISVSILIGIVPAFAIDTPTGKATGVTTTDAPEFSIRQMLDLADQYDPNLKASQSRETEARSSVGISKSYFLPDLSFEAIDSTGFPGSTSALGVGGITGSPYRSKLGAGFVLTQNIFDFGRTYYGVQASKAQAASQEKLTDVNRYQTDQEVISAYFDCVLNRAQKETWTELAQDSTLVAKEVERFVKTGQRSIVDRYLSNLQKEDALTQVARFQTREKVSIQRLAVVTGQSPSFRCPALNGLTDDSGLIQSTHENPIIGYAKDQRQAAEAKLDQARSGNLPKIVGLASTGMLQDTRLVGKQDYALGIGLAFPLFEGFRVKDEIDQNAAAAQEKDYLVEASQYGLDNLNRQLDEKIESSAIRNEHLNGELAIAEQGFAVAKKRYFSFQGTLIDVREALTGLSRVKSDLNESRAEYLESKYIKDVLNGAR